MNTATSTSAVIPFAFDNHLFRAITIDADPWFVAKDVCDVLDLKDTNKAVSGLDEDEKGTHKVRTLRGEQEMIIISESGLYTMVIRSNKPQAKSFRKWVTAEVLPSIRKTGSYVGDAAEPNRKTVDFNYYRRTPSPSGLDIRYTLDLTKIIMRPSAKSLVVLERLTGIDCSDLAEEGTEELGTVHLFVSECLRDCPGQRVSLADVYSGYRVWFRESRLPAANKIHALKTLSSSLRQSGFEVIKLGGRFWVMDISLTLEVQA
jgi:prophage antirepressor-like protein